MKLKALINQFLQHSLIKGKKSRSTIENYERYLNDFLRFVGDIEASEITLDLIDSYQKKLIKSGMSLSTQSYYLISIRVFLKWLRVRKDLPTLDPEKIELPKISRKIQDALSEEEIKKLLGSPSPRNKEGIRVLAILHLFLSSGIRVGELVKVKIDDVDFNTGRFIVNGKGNKERVCFLNKDAIFFLKKYLETRQVKSPYLIASYSRRDGSEKNPISSRSIQRLVKEYAQKAGIKKVVSPHALRRSFACQLLRKNTDIRYIKDFLGHENLQTTQFYTKVTGEELEKVYKTANASMVKNVPGGVKNEFVVLAKSDYYKLCGMISQNRKLIKEVLKKL